MLYQTGGANTTIIILFALCGCVMCAALGGFAFYEYKETCHKSSCQSCASCKSEKTCPHQSGCPGHNMCVKGSCMCVKDSSKDYYTSIKDAGGIETCTVVPPKTTKPPGDDPGCKGWTDACDDDSECCSGNCYATITSEKGCGA